MNKRQTKFSPKFVPCCAYGSGPPVRLSVPLGYHTFDCFQRLDRATDPS